MPAVFHICCSCCCFALRMLSLPASLHTHCFHRLEVNYLLWFATSSRQECFKETGATWLCQGYILSTLNTHIMTLLFLALLKWKKRFTFPYIYLVLYLLTEGRQLVLGMRMTEIDAVFKTHWCPKLCCNVAEDMFLLQVHKVLILREGSICCLAIMNSIDFSPSELWGLYI